MDKYLTYFAKVNSLMSFLKDLKNRGLKQAYLFNSYDRLKNLSTTKLFALMINCEEKNAPCFSCPNCKKILSNNSLDVFTYPKSKGIVVEDIKEIIDSCYVSPADFKYKIYILNDFENANIASQNKFLKTLEEPPKDVIFLINTTNLSKVLDTIKSRTLIINIPTINSTELNQVVENTDLTINEIIKENSDNELGNFITLTEKQVDKTFEFCVDLLLNLNSSKDLLFYSSSIVKDKENLYNYFFALLSLFRDMLVMKIDPNKINNISLRKDIEKLSSKYSYKAICEILNKLISSNKELSYNTSETLVIDNILINILEERFKWK